MHDYKKAKSKDPKAGEKEPMKMNKEWFRKNNLEKQ